MFKAQKYFDRIRLFQDNKWQDVVLSGMSSFHLSVAVGNCMRSLIWKGQNVNSIPE